VLSSLKCSPVWRWTIRVFSSVRLWATWGSWNARASSAEPPPADETAVREARVVVGRGVPEILYPAYRQYVASRVEVNDAMAALLAGSRLAAHTLSLTTGSTATLAQLFPAVPHIERFNLRSDAARVLLDNADHHLASVAVPYALATHEDFVMEMLEFLKAEGRTLVTHGKSIRAWNMHTVLFETCGATELEDWTQSFHVLREVRNCITHEGGGGSQKLRDAIADRGTDARAGWERMNQGLATETVEVNGRLALTAEHVFTAFAVTKRRGREINAVLGRELDGAVWARVAVADYDTGSSKVKNSSGWRRSLVGYVRQNYAQANITAADLEAAARHLGLWTIPRWS